MCSVASELKNRIQGVSSRESVSLYQSQLQGVHSSHSARNRAESIESI
jgi:hypothetical protein